MLAKLRNLAVPVLVFVFSTPFVLAADGNGRILEISDSVYSFTLGEGNHLMFVIGENSVAVFETFHSEALWKFRKSSDCHNIHIGSAMRNGWK